MVAKMVLFSIGPNAAIAECTMRRHPHSYFDFFIDLGYLLLALCLFFVPVLLPSETAAGQICDQDQGLHVCIEYTGRSRLLDIIPPESVAQLMPSPPETAEGKTETAKKPAAGRKEEEAQESSSPSNEYVVIYCVKIRNESKSKVSLTPTSFYLLTLDDKIAILNKAIFNAIEWPNKMRPVTLAPGDSTEGHLIFPHTHIAPRKLVHNNTPKFEMDFF